MKDTLPVVTYLREEALKDNHKAEINKLLEKPIDLDQEDLTLETLLLMNVKAHKDEIGEISIWAWKEKELFNQFKKYEEEWKLTALPVQMYKDNRDVFILANIDELTEFLEESLLQISNIVAAKYSAPFRS